jgi:hypothetical protein
MCFLDVTPEPRRGESCVVEMSCATKVDQNSPSIRLNHDVLWCDVSVNDTTRPQGDNGSCTRLRARLESAASTAVRAPVLAVIEYNYERDGEIIIPAGAKAVGHIGDANRSGYVDLQFDSLLMPDGASVPIEAAATDLELRPLKGKVSGKNAGKNALVRSLSGIGQASAMFVGQGSLSQPLSESDLMRERVSDNIGETGDEEVSRLSVNQQIVVTVSAGVPSSSGRDSFDNSEILRGRRI